MRKISIISLFGALAVLVIASCTKQEGVNINENYTKGAYLTYDQPVPTAPGRYDYSNIATASYSIKVKPVGSEVTSINIYVGSSSDPATWKLIKNVAVTPPTTTLSVSGAEVAKALGINPSALLPGTALNYYNEAVLADGRKFSLANTNSDFESQGGYKMALRWSAVVFCAYNASVFTGNFKVVKDGWADFSPGDLIAVSNGPGANQITIICYPSPAAGGTNRKPMVLTVDPNTNLVTVPEQIYGDYPPVTNVTARGSGSVNSCTGTITLNLTHKYSGTDYTDNVLILQK